MSDPGALSLLLICGMVSGFGLLVLGLAAVLVVVARRSLRQVDETLAAAAERFGGRVRPRAALTAPWLELPIDDLEARLTYFTGSKNSTPWTRLELQHAFPGRLHVAPEGLWAGLQKLFGGQDLHLGDPRFDQAFLVQGTPEAWVREVLDPDTRARLHRLGELGKTWSGGVRLDVTATSLRLTVPRYLVGSREHLLAFLEEGLALVRRLRAGRTGPRIEVRDVLDQGRCPVCADTIQEAPRRCGGCGTAHHGECWEFLGGCAILGCGERPRDRPREPLKW